MSGGVWALSWRISQWRARQFWTSVGLWCGFFVTPAAIWWAGGRAYDAVEVGDAGAAAAWALLLLAAEAAQFAFLYFGVFVFVGLWVQLESLLQANMLTAQVASGKPDAGRPVASAGESITHFRDDTHDVVWFIDSLLDAFGGGVFAAVALSMMASINTAATLAVVVPMVSVVAVTASFDTKVKEFRRADRAATVAVTGFLGDVMASAMSIKVADAADHVVDRLRLLADRRRHTAVRDRVLEDSIMAWSAGAADVSFALVILVVSGALVAGTFTLGDLALYLGLLSWLTGFPRMVGRMLARRKQAQVAFDGMRMLVADEDAERVAMHRDLAVGLDAGERERARRAGRRIGERIPLQRLDVVDVAVRHPGHPGLAPVSFSLERGSFTVITGPVGAGKSSLLRALVGLIDADDAVVTGTVLWNGVVVEDRAGFFVPPQASYLSQVPQLLSDSVADNILLGLDDRYGPGGALGRALALAAVDDDVAEMPGGLDTMIGPRGLRLSGGQRQRVAAARALVHGPELIVLDDISSALDVETELRLWTNLADAGATVLAVSHRRVAFDRADQIITLGS